MTVAQGFQVELVACEPMVRQPVAIEFDDRGRLWVIQYLQYPNPAGLKRVEVDRYSRTVYDRVPDPPPHGPKGADRITILEDTDGDGRADRAKNFIDGLNLASGLTFGYGGVFVLNVPYLLFYPDRNHDDVPDGEPEVLLRGFGMQDAHSVANSLTWGPAGWLYGTQGSTVTAKIRGIEFQQGVWRYHPRTREFELFCEGGGNSWGLDFDEEGRLLYSTNVGGYVMLHGVQGGFYWKQFTKHGALHNAYSFGFFDHVLHKDFTGGHVTVGGVVYQGDSFPPQWRGAYIAADLLGHAVHWHKMTPHGSSLTSEHGGTLLAANDTWFAPSDVTVGPDGAIYVADWYDPRMAHPDPDAEWDRSNGRIYRIRATDTPATPHVNLQAKTSAELVEALASENNGHVRRARRLLTERRDETTFPRLEAIALSDRNGRLPLEALWALYASGGFDDSVAQRLLAHRSAAVRAWTVRFLGDSGSLDNILQSRLINLARSDPDPAVRSQLAASAGRLPVEQMLPLVAALWTQARDVDDPHIPLLLWWALEARAISDSSLIVGRFCQPDVWESPIASRWLAPRLMRRYAAEADTVSLEACARLLASAPDVDALESLLAALDEGLQGRRAEAAPESLRRTLASLLENKPADSRLLRLAVRTALPEARDRAWAMIADRTVEEADRLALISVLTEAAPGDDWQPLFVLLNDDEPEAIRSAAMAALGAYADKKIAAAVLACYPRLATALRSRARDLLFSRRNWALVLLDQIDTGQLPADEIPPEQLRRLAVYEDEKIDALVLRHWGNITGGTPQERLAEVRRLNNDLRAGVGDSDRGRALYEKHCATCHRLFDEGVELGPDLTHANRKDRDYLLISLVDPSSLVRKEHLSWIATTVDGRVLTGLIVEESPTTVTLADAKNQRTTLGRNQIEELRASTVSLMPDDLLKELKPQQLRDLFSYLQSDGTQGKAGN